MKEKGKAHPFAGHLNATEEVLWMSPQADETPMAQFKSMMQLGSGLAVFALVIALANGAQEDLDPIGLIMVVVMVVACVAVPYALYRGGTWLFGRGRRPERIYAVTSERLLYRNKDAVSSIPLEVVPSISVFPSEGTKGTFSFGAFFPMWPDVDDAITVKHIIEDAQKQRLEDLEA